MKTLILAFPGAEDLGQKLATRLDCDASAIEVRRFPDGEQLVRLRTSVAGCRVLLAAQLDHPDDKTLPVLFAADAARELGAAQVGLVAPYLPYMRQDSRFRPGEAITSRTYARLLSKAVDFVVTVGPHLHRIHDLREIYSIPTRVASPARAIAAWLTREVPNAVLVGTGPESAGWVGEVAAIMQAPLVVTDWQQDGPERILPQASTHAGRTPVVMEDIATTGQTLMAAAAALHSAGWGPPVAVVVHALLQQEDVEALHHAGVPRIASCNTVPHRTGVITVDDELVEAIQAMVLPEHA